MPKKLLSFATNRGYCAITILQILQRIAPGILDIVLNIHPESKDEIKNDWRTKGKERNINKIPSDS